MVRWVIQEIEIIYSGILEKRKMTEIIKRRLKKVIKEKKKFASIKFYPTWIIEESMFSFTDMTENAIEINF